MGGPALRLRPATADDARLVWEWVNDPLVRASSFAPAPIPWTDHEAWFAGLLADDARVLFIVHDVDDAPIGQVRFERRADDLHEIAISLAAAGRGRGIGAEVIAAGLRSLWSRAPGTRVLARIKPTNHASLRAFATAGFTVDRNTPAAVDLTRAPD